MDAGSANDPYITIIIVTCNDDHDLHELQEHPWRISNDEDYASEKRKKFYFTLKGRNFVDMSSIPTSI